MKIMCIKIHTLIIASLFSAFFSYTAHDRSFVILIPSYNNIKFYKENLDSVFQQTYQNYRIIYVDDVSSDKTADAVADYVKKKGFDHKVTLIRNTQRCLALCNIYTNIHRFCLDHEVVVILDGDDTLAGNDVLEFLNKEYKESNIWITFGNVIIKSTRQPCSWSMPVPHEYASANNFRGWRHGPTHLRTFYAWLFKKIKKEDLLHEGDFYKMTYDVAMLMPMMEMSGMKRLKFIDKILYVYNDKNPINDHKKNHLLQLYLNKVIRSKPKYEVLPNHFTPQYGAVV